MLYMEDYLEMIEHLPQELRDRFTDMREMDLSVQNSMDSLEKRVKVFFSNARRMKQIEKDEEYSIILKDYYKTLEDADEKVQLANQMYELVDRYLRRLDQELHKFKMELEADNKGITEVLEKRSLELDQPQPTNSNQKENRYSMSSRERRESRRDSSLDRDKIMSTIINSVPEIRAPIQQSSVGYTLGHMGAGSNAIAAAASQAIAATQQMQQGRRTASLKASYEAIHIGVNPINEFSIGRELAGATQNAMAAAAAAVSHPHEPPRKHKKKNSSSSSISTAANSAPVSSLGTNVTQNTAVNSSPAPAEELQTETIADPTIEGNADSSDFMDPNEPRYCICNQVSYGYMVACDNVGCPLEWFHYACVDIIAPPKGKWYCPQCTSSMKRRGHRKNQ